MVETDLDIRGLYHAKPSWVRRTMLASQQAGYGFDALIIELNPDVLVFRQTNIPVP